MAHLSVYLPESIDVSVNNVVVHLFTQSTGVSNANQNKLTKFCGQFIVVNQSLLWSVDNKLGRLIIKYKD